MTGNVKELSQAPEVSTTEKIIRKMSELSETDQDKLLFGLECYFAGVTANKPA